MSRHFYKIRLQSIRTKATLIGLIAIILCSSCAALYSKDDYIQAFADFITETDENCKTYSKSDWEKADMEYLKFSEVEYDRFKSKFNELDSPAVSKLKVIYMVLKYNANADKKKK